MRKGLIPSNIQNTIADIEAAMQENDQAQAKIILEKYYIPTQTSTDSLEIGIFSKTFNGIINNKFELACQLLAHNVSKSLNYAYIILRPSHVDKIPKLVQALKTNNTLICVTIDISLVENILNEAKLINQLTDILKANLNISFTIEIDRVFYTKLKMLMQVIKQNNNLCYFKHSRSISNLFIFTSYFYSYSEFSYAICYQMPHSRIEADIMKYVMHADELQPQMRDSDLLFEHRRHTINQITLWQGTSEDYLLKIKQANIFENLEALNKFILQLPWYQHRYDQRLGEELIDQRNQLIIIRDEIEAENKRYKQNLFKQALVSKEMLTLNDEIILPNELWMHIAQYLNASDILTPALVNKASPTSNMLEKALSKPMSSLLQLVKKTMFSGNLAAWCNSAINISIKVVDCICPPLQQLNAYINLNKHISATMLNSLSINSTMQLKEI